MTLARSRRGAHRGRRRSVRRSGWAFALIAVVGTLGTWAVGVDAVHAQDSQPTIAVSPAQAAVGDTVTVDLVGWPSGTVLASFCANGAANGSADCSLAGQHTVEIRADGTGHTRLTVDPPGRCPCVVRVATPRLDVVRSIEIAVPALGSDPVPGAEPVAGPGSSIPGPGAEVAAAPAPADSSPDALALALVLALVVLVLFGIGVAVAWASGRRSGRRTARAPLPGVPSEPDPTRT